MTTLTKRYPFSASHRLSSPALSAERNREIFGKCANPYGHGHNYFLEVSVRRQPDPGTGMVVGRAKLDAWVRAAILDRIDHAHLNAELPDFPELVPTAENILVVADRWLREAWPRHFPGEALGLAGLRLEETPRNSARC